MHELGNGTQREIFAQLYLDLSTALSAPWRERGISIRQSFAMVRMVALITVNHRQNKVTTAQEIEQALGIPRSTAQRRCALMAKHGYLTIHGSDYQISEKFATASMLSSAEFAKIEAAIHRACHRLHKFTDDA